MLNDFVNWLTKEKTVAALIIAQIITNSITALSKSLNEAVIGPSTSRIIGPEKDYDISILIGGMVTFLINLALAYALSKALRR